MFLEDVLHEFIFDCQIRNLSTRTIKSYKNNNLRFITFIKDEFGIIELKKMDAKHIKSYLALLRSQKLTESYANNILKSIRVFLKYCVDEGYIDENPCHKIKWIQEPKKKIKAFTDEQVKQMLKVFGFWDYLDSRNGTILVAFLETGIRSLELCNIRNSDIRDRDILIQGKGNRERYVPITPFLKKYMIRYERIKHEYFKDKLTVEDYYFLSRNGRQLTVETNLYIFKQIEEQAGIEDVRCSPHTCRHYYAQSQLKNGIDVYSLSRLLGHENINITKRYLQSIEDADIVDMGIKTSPLMSLKMRK